MRQLKQLKRFQHADPEPAQPRPQFLQHQERIQERPRIIIIIRVLVVQVQQRGRDVDGQVRQRRAALPHEPQMHRHVDVGLRVQIVPIVQQLQPRDAAEAVADPQR